MNNGYFDVDDYTIIVTDEGYKKVSKKSDFGEMLLQENKAEITKKILDNINANIENKIIENNNKNFFKTMFLMASGFGCIMILIELLSLLANQNLNIISVLSLGFPITAGVAVAIVEKRKNNKEIQELLQKKQIIEEAYEYEKRKAKMLSESVEKEKIENYVPIDIDNQINNVIQDINETFELCAKQKVKTSHKK
jgi:hypothetical protein